jgi:hypothetical protein
MALPSSGPLSMSQINAEFGRGNNLNAYRGTTYYTSSGGPFTFSSGAISFSNFYGTQATSPTFSFSIASNQDQANLRSLAIAAGWSGSGAVIATLNAGVYIYSSNVSVAGLTIDGSWPGGVTLINNGFIMGMGGHGGGTRLNTQTDFSSNIELQNGGIAISLGVSCTIQNNSYIGGGGGGGAGVVAQNPAATQINVRSSICGGGGAGGAQGGTAYGGAAPGSVTAAGGAGGGLGAAGSNGVNGTALYDGISSGGGGGRIMPGARTGSPNAVYGGGNATAGYGAEGGVSGANQSIASTVTTTTNGNSNIPGLGGQAGGSGAALAGYYTYSGQTAAGGGGGGWGSSGGAARAIVSLNTAGPADATATGATGGKCVNLNGFTATFSVVGTRYGAIS